MNIYLYYLLVFVICGVSGAVQNTFVVNLKKKFFFIPCALCFGVVSLPYLLFSDPLHLVLSSSVIVVLSTAVLFSFYYGPFRFRLYNFLLQHVITVGVVQLSVSLVHIFSFQNPQVVSLGIIFLLNALWVGVMFYEHLNTFTLIPLTENNYGKSLWPTIYGFLVQQIGMCFFLILQKKPLNTKISAMELAFTALASTFCIILSLIWCSTEKPRMLMEKQLKTFEQQNQLLSRQVADEVEFNKRLRTVRHDHRSQLITLAGLLEDGRINEAKEMLTQQIDTSGRLGSFVYSYDPIVNVVLRYMDKGCNEFGVRFEYVVRLPEEILIGSTRLSSLLMNIANNALECCGKLKKPQKAYVKIEIYLQNEFLVVRCENTVEEIPKIIDGRIASTKQDPNREHGVGLESIHWLCENSGGRMTLEVLNSCFRITAIVKNAFMGE